MFGPGFLETAVGRLHKLRLRWCVPMRELFGGVVKSTILRTVVAPPSKRGASTDKSTPVDDRSGKVCTHQFNRKLRLAGTLAVADSPGSKQLFDFERTTVEPGSLIRTGRSPDVSVFLATEGSTHHYTLATASPEPGHVTLPGPHPSVLTCYKRLDAGTHHYRVERGANCSIT